MYLDISSSCGAAGCIVEGLALALSWSLIGMWWLTAAALVALFTTNAPPLVVCGPGCGLMASMVRMLGCTALLGAEIVELWLAALA